jgi:curved DNA-binding protein
MSNDEFTDYYGLSRVSPHGSAEEIEKAYQFEIRYWHPDRVAGRPPEYQRQATRTFIELGRAREILLDPNKRSLYDEIYGE